MLFTSKRSRAPHSDFSRASARALQSVASQAVKIDAALKVDVHVTGGGNRAVPLPMRIGIFGAEEVGRRRPI